MERNGDENIWLAEITKKLRWLFTVWFICYVLFLPTFLESFWINTHYNLSYFSLEAQTERT